VSEDTIEVDQPNNVDLRAADGRVPGHRGLATRQRLLEATAEQLESSG